MQYRSTRGSITEALNSPQTVIQGLAPDGGLFVPVDFPKVNLPLKNLSRMNYQEIAQLVLSWFFDDLAPEQLTTIVKDAYGSQWEQDAIAPVSAQHSGNYYLELFHGPTLAFKDIALQALPRLMKRALTIEQINNQIIILTATSGDTGTASMRGFSNQEGTQVIVFYPHGGVSPVQLHQMLGQRGQNLTAIAIDGNFDDAQTAVKAIFNNQSFNQELRQNGFQFSSANSMNIGRLVPQIVYYLSAYGQLVRRNVIQAGEPLNFAVPTGNFGDILAGYYAKKLGLPINRLICASDENNVLTDFFNSGKYDRQRPFYLTNSPAMDILVSSNLERLLFDLYDENATEVKILMDQLNQSGSYQISSSVLGKLSATFNAGFATQKQVLQEIDKIYAQNSYAIDPHTAVASFVARQYQSQHRDDTPMVIVSTASPYKFPETVYKAITGKEIATSGLAAIKQLQSVLKQPLNANVQQLFEQSSKAEQVIEPSAMAATISEILKLK
ncbi:threonine synthase [uncultured Limosilactobacillus sp.]|uniref:threonine synthase n=1 Tax=uncultured Limosilactobacillus sp. TaxID=2837629 RepID=UPI0025DF549C|nr:threonine synthase [uncultured Limosilactobacillus sp.]